MNNVLAALTSIAILFAGPSFGDTNVSRVHISQDESTGQPDYAILTIYDMSAEDSPGWLNETCILTVGGHDPTPNIEILAFGTRPAERQENVSAETVKLRVDTNPLHELRVDVMDVLGDGEMQPYTATDDLPFLARGAREFVDELSRGQRLIAQIGNVAPVVHLDLAAARPDIVDFKNACDRMHANFQRSPQR